MRRPSGITVALIPVILLLLLPAATNVATESLPGSWQPYLWLAWPTMALLAIPALLVEVRRYARAHDDAATAPVTMPSGASTLAMRRELPRDVPDFSGRTTEFAHVVDILRTRETSATVCTIYGMPGVGKTALAVHAAHRAAGEFSDGQLFIDLHGFTPGVPPVATADALDALLMALGAAPEQIPAGLEDRARLYRHMLADKRLLVVIDDVATEQQVRPLLPAAPACAVVATSRRRLPGLEGAHHVALGVMQRGEATEMFRKIAGINRSEEPDAVGAVARLCGDLPLAIRIAGAQMATRPRWSTAMLAHRLRDKKGLHAGELSVDAAFAISYDNLSAQAQRAFRLLGLHPGALIQTLTAAALCDASLAEAEDLLEHLSVVSLLEERVPGHYTFHDLVRDYAYSVATATETPDTRLAAETRLIAHYVGGARAAAAHLDPDTRPTGSVPGAPAVPVPTFADYGEALRWYEDERPNLVMSVGRADELGLDEYTWRLANALLPYFYLRGFTTDWINTEELSLAAARRLGNRSAEADALASLAVVHRRLGEYSKAVDYHEQALVRYRERDNQQGVMTTLTDLGIVYRRLGKYHDALEHQSEALRLHGEVGDQHGEAMTLTNLGIVHERLGQYQKAIEFHEMALSLALRIGERHVQAMSLTNLGIVYQKLGRFDQALRYHRDARKAAEEYGDRHAEGHTMNNIGVVLAATDEYAKALEHQQAGLALLRLSGSRGDECETLNDIGVTLRLSGDLDSALDHHRRALELARQIRDRYLQARALDGMAASMAGTEPTQSQVLRIQALAIYRELEVPEAGTLASQVDEAD